MIYISKYFLWAFQVYDVTDHVNRVHITFGGHQLRCLRRGAHRHRRPADRQSLRSKCSVLQMPRVPRAQVPWARVPRVPLAPLAPNPGSPGGWRPHSAEEKVHLDLR